jgi:hypothetical protein
MAFLSKETIAAALVEQEKLRGGYEPTEADLAGAPTLSDWLLEVGGSLVGYVSGHPSIPDGPVTTSIVIAMDEDAGWARTVSRYYRLRNRLRIGVENGH